MNTQQPQYPDKRSHLTLELLQAIENKDDISQRHLAQQMGVALGLANSYLKRCVKKGWVKIKTAPANRYFYYLTPHGFAEKARLTGEFFTTSLTLFRESGQEYSDLFDQCAGQQLGRIVFAGLSDLTEIAYTRSLQADVAVIAVWQPQSSVREFFGLPVIDQLAEAPPFDAVVVTSLEQTNQLLEALQQTLGAEQIKMPPMLLNLNYRHQQAHT